MKYIDANRIDEDERILSEEPSKSLEKPSKDLEEAAEEYLQNVEARFLRTLEHPTAKEAFIAGAEWQKSQMLKDAVKCDVIVPIYEENDTWSAKIKIPGRYGLGDKVHIIIVKED